VIGGTPFSTDQDKAALVATLAGSLVLAAVMGGFRASTVRIWSDAGVAWSRGTWITVVLWVVSLGSQLAYGYLFAGKSSSAGRAAPASCSTWP
jgi:hypothetical protein